MKSLKEIYRTKVAVVGSSINLIGKNLGKEIDTFDFVVKFNGSVLVQHEKEYCKSYGKKDDIHFFNSPYIRTVQPDLNQYPYIKLFLFKTHFPQYNSFPHQRISRSFNKLSYLFQGLQPYSGVAVLSELVKYKLIKIKIFGMDLYKDQPKIYNGDWSNYYKGYIPEEMKKLTDELHLNSSLPHSRYLNANVLNSLINQFPIDCDRELLYNIKTIIEQKDKYI